MSNVSKYQPDELGENGHMVAGPAAGQAVEGESFLSFTDFWQQKTGEDISGQGHDPRESAQEEADEILRQAKEEAGRIEQEAYDKGFSQGEAEGKTQGAADYNAKIRELTAQVGRLDGQQLKVLHRYKEDILVLVKTMVERLVRHEVSVNPLVIEKCLKEAMGYVVENSMVHVHLHADDFNRIKKASLEDPSLLEGKNRVQLVEDPNISPGGCLLKTDFGEIDSTLEYAKEKLYEAVDKSFLAALAAAPGVDEIDQDA